MDIVLIRHGQTESNRDMRYLGRTDEPLSKEGAEKAAAAGCFPGMETVFVSPMLRARQTAEILFPNAVQRVYEDLREMDFGDFEGRAVSELSNDPAYNAWIASNCTLPCPGGENPTDFAARCRKGFCKAVADAAAERLERAIFVLHGGVIMNLMCAFADREKPFFEWFIKNCACFCASLDPETFRKTQTFSSWAGPEKLSL